MALDLWSSLWYVWLNPGPLHWVYGVLAWSLSQWTTKRGPISPSLFCFYNFVYLLIFGGAGSLVAASMGYSSVALHVFLIAAVSSVVEHRLYFKHSSIIVVTRELNSHDSWALEPRLNSCFTAYGIIPDWGSNLQLLHWQANSFPLSHQETLFPSLKQREWYSPSLTLKVITKIW